MKASPSNDFQFNAPQNHAGRWIAVVWGIRCTVHREPGATHDPRLGHEFLFTRDNVAPRQFSHAENELRLPPSNMANDFS